MIVAADARSPGKTRGETARRNDTTSTAGRNDRVTFPDRIPQRPRAKPYTTGAERVARVHDGDDGGGGGNG